MKQSLKILAMILVIAGVALAQANWRADNITIRTEADLRQLAVLVNNGNDFFNRKITLANNIELVGGEWVPIGIGQTSFIGKFDGNGNTISGLEGKQGMFENVDWGGSISNLNLVVNVKGDQGIGGLAGRNLGFIYNCFVRGNITGNSTVGGLVGINSLDESGKQVHGTIWNSGFISGTVSGNVVGGLVGTNLGTIGERSHAAGNVLVNEVLGGGLVGINIGVIERSYATGSVKGGAVVGGLVGANGVRTTMPALPFEDLSGFIVNSYAIGNVSGSDNVGGLVGINDIDSEISFSYATVNVVSVEDAVGELVGINVGRIGASYALIGNIETLIGVREGTVSNSGLLTIEQMRRQSSFVGWDFSDSFWRISRGINNGFPHFRKSTATDQSFVVDWDFILIKGLYAFGFLCILVGLYLWFSQKKKSKRGSLGIATAILQSVCLGKEFSV